MVWGINSWRGEETRPLRSLSTCTPGSAKWCSKQGHNISQTYTGCKRICYTLCSPEATRQQTDENTNIFSKNGGAIFCSVSTTGGPVETAATGVKCSSKARSDASKCITRTRCKFPSISSNFRSFSSATRYRGENWLHSDNVEISGTYVIRVSVGVVFVSEGQISGHPLLLTAQGINQRNAPLSKIWGLTVVS